MRFSSARVIAGPIGPAGDADPYSRMRNVSLCDSLPSFALDINLYILAPVSDPLVQATANPPAVRSYIMDLLRSSPVFLTHSGMKFSFLCATSSPVNV